MRRLLTVALLGLLLVAAAQKRQVKLMMWRDTTTMAKYAILESAVYRCDYPTIRLKTFGRNCNRQEKKFEKGVDGMPI